MTRISMAVAMAFAMALILGSCRRAQDPGSAASTDEYPRASVYSPEQEEVMDAITRLDVLRRSLAASLPEGSVDTETFAAICRPVGIQAKDLGEEKGWIVRQLSHKYRNPEHRADHETDSLIRRFVDDPDLDSLWVEPTGDATAGVRYLRRIEIEESCLVCHGPKESRPAFIVEGYPEDLAYDFEVGDLRGLYSVSMERDRERPPSE